MTPEERSEYNKAWAKKNKEKRDAYLKKYNAQQKNKDRTLARRKERQAIIIKCGCGETINGNNYQHKNSKLHKLYEKMLKNNINE